MTPHWLQRQGRDRLILVFAGWGLGPAIFAGLQAEADVLVIEDHRRIDFDPAPLRAYTNCTAVGYSFGVAALLHWLATFDAGAPHPDRLVAINGTPYPADGQRGIPPERVAATAAGLSRESFARFARRCGLRGAPPDLDLPARQQELRAIADRGTPPIAQFDRIWIPDQDHIIPPEAQRRAWVDQSGAQRHHAGPHMPFAPGQPWSGWLS